MTIPLIASAQVTGANMRVVVGDKTFTATLADNATAEAFYEMLPLSLNMIELNGNEKYYYLPSNLPAAAANPGTIHAGDIMLYGRSCVVLFYKTFNTSYSYTPIGAIDNPDGLAAALGTGNVTVRFERIPDARVGDVNGDNEVDVADVNMLINYILGAGNTGYSPGGVAALDINGDNEINVADVSILINIILNK